MVFYDSHPIKYHRFENVIGVGFHTHVLHCKYNLSSTLMLGFQVELEFLYVPSVRFVWSKKQIWSFFITIALIEIQCETILK